MDNYLTQYQSANLSDSEIIANFIVRKNEFEKVISDIRNTKSGSSFQHYVFVGWRGSGKSTLLRRIQAEINTDAELDKKYVAVNLGEEQSGIYRLYDLWDYVIRDLNELGFDIKKASFKEFGKDPKEYTTTLHAQIIAALREQGKGLVLLVDNVDRIFDSLKDETALFRELLINFLDIRIVGGSTVMSEQFWKYEMPFYQYFTIKHLGPLSLEEIKLLLEHWSVVRGLPEIKDILRVHPGKIQSIRMLTDGTPRTMSIFVNMIINRPVQHSYGYLAVIVDKATPIYQERLGTLSPAQKKVITELSFLWEAATIEELVDKCNMESKTISALLSQLFKAGYVEKIKGKTKNLLYRVKERFFNLWLIMSQGGPQQRSEAKYLTDFLQTWYDESQLNELCGELLVVGRNPETKKDYLHSMSRALLHSDKVASNRKIDFYLGLRNELNIKESELGKIENYLKDLSEEIGKALEENDNEKAIKMLEASSLERGLKHYGLGLAFGQMKEVEKSEEHYKIACEDGHVYAFNNLGNLYLDQGKVKLAEDYYKQAIAKGHVSALFNLAILYKEKGELKLAEDYYKQAIAKGDVSGLFNLAILYKEKGELKLAEDYYKQAIAKGHIPALTNLANLYSERGELELAEDYYKQAIAKGDVGALNNLAILYSERGELELAEDYYKQAIAKGHVGALYNLAILYKERGELELAVDYYKQAIAKGHVGALNNLAILYDERGDLVLAEDNYKQAIAKGNVVALYNLSIIYEKRGELDLSEDYLKQAIAKDHIDALWNLVVLNYEKNNKENILKLVNEHKELFKKIDVKSKMMLFLYLGDMDKFNQYFAAFKLRWEELETSALNLQHLLIHKQYQLTLDFFTDYESAKEKFKPLYFATLKLIDNNHPNLLKMPPEIEENVNDILNKIKERQAFYYG